jgi:hypothetical protein
VNKEGDGAPDDLPDGYMMVILTAEGRQPAETDPERAEAFKSLFAYSETARPLSGPRGALVQWVARSHPTGRACSLPVHAINGTSGPWYSARLFRSRSPK